VHYVPEHYFCLCKFKFEFAFKLFLEIQKVFFSFFTGSRADFLTLVVRTVFPEFGQDFVTCLYRYQVLARTVVIDA
jgi:hypothetical protein